MTITSHQRTFVFDQFPFNRFSLRALASGPLCHAKLARSFTSSLWLESKPTSLRRLCFSNIPRRRSRYGSSLNARPMLTGLGPPLASSLSSEPNLPCLVRFSDRSLLRAVHGRPGKRALATPGVVGPATVAGDNLPPDAAIIYYNNTDGALAREGDSSDTAGKMDCAAAKARDRKEAQVHHGKANHFCLGRVSSVTLGDVAVVNGVFLCRDLL